MRAVKIRHAPIGGCLVQRKPDNRAPRGNVIQSDQSALTYNLEKFANFVALKDEKELTRFSVA